jgi:DNA-binding IclR family transcriptional regulator
MVPDGSPAAGSGTQAIQRAVALLRLLAAHNRTGMRLVDVYRAAGLERATVHRILQGLVAEQLVRQDKASKRYYLGSLLYEIGLAAAPRPALRDLCHPHLRTVAEQTGDTVFLTIRSGFDGVCIDRAEGAFPIKAFVLEVGRRRPLNIGAGATAILGALPDEEIASICAVNRGRTLERYPNYSEAELLQRIARYRRTGYLLNEVQEVPGVRSLGMAIRGADRAPLAALSVSTVAARLAGERVEEVASYVGEAVRAIEATLE